MNTNNTSRVIIALYRAKLRECYKVGYKYGDWNPQHIVDINRLGKKKIIRYRQQGLLGSVLWNTIRDEYKYNKNEDDNMITNILLEEAFMMLRKVNKIIGHKKYNK